MQEGTTRICGVGLSHLVSGMSGSKVTLSPGRRVRDTDRRFLNTVEEGIPGILLKICWDKRSLLIIWWTLWPTSFVRVYEIE